MNYRLIAALALAWTAPSMAQSGGTFQLTWSSIDGGGGRATSGGGFTLTASVGQPDATPAAALTGGAFRLVPGFLAAGSDRIFANGFE
jgi:hypothetical protein